MGFTLPSSDSPAEKVRALMLQKQNIESEIEANITILKANNCDLQTPLVDRDGFPRADMDIYAVRGARVRIIELRNDLKDVTDAIAKGLEAVYDPKLAAPSASKEDAPSSSTAEAPKPFARVDGVAPGSPAADAGLKREDLFVKFGQLTYSSFTSSSLQAIAEVVAENENCNLPIRVLREGQMIVLTLTPRKGWGGRGMLGCHIVPYSS
ncbi:hypothetical protein K435DRAFT_854336 [Dendrothele bispora CBS 962.96]|uniref:Probable 26S proteasome regulatory subunit p27 n=1 Tax=Dendrothele bispora (strain CBS 962.96) TaxID=1314807 RepID=A0A4S8MDY6_DENBC|nr:hypothetical protein K435DRAFT_854336 [Dendrothele bispora CBS 962.96]